MNDESALAPQKEEIVGNAHPTTRGATNHADGRKPVSTLPVLEGYASASNFPPLRPDTPKLVLTFFLHLQTHFQKNVKYMFHNLGWVTTGDRCLVHRTVVDPQNVLRCR